VSSNFKRNGKDKKGKKTSPSAVHNGPTIVHSVLGPTNRDLLFKTKITSGVITSLIVAWW
jgi:hypothetical protein